MWKLEAAEGHDPWLFSTNNFAGRQVWKFDPDDGTPEEHAEVEKAREKFSQKLSHVKASSDILKNLQLIRENGIDLSIPSVRLGDREEISCEKAEIALRKAVRFTSALQAKDGHWPSEFSALLFLQPFLAERDATPLHQAARLLINSQLESGEFPQQEITGASLKTSMLHYASYRNIFPLWALGEYRKHVLLPKKNT